MINSKINLNYRSAHSRSAVPFKNHQLAFESVRTTLRLLLEDVILEKGFTLNLARYPRMLLRVNCVSFNKFHFLLSFKSSLTDNDACYDELSKDKNSTKFTKSGMLAK